MQAYFEMALAAVRSSHTLSRFYGCYEYTIAVSNRKRHPYDALQRLCDARRRIPRLDMTESHGSLMKRILNETLCKDGQFLLHRHNRLMQSFIGTKRFQLAREVFADEPLQEKRRLRHYRENSPPGRQGNMLVLKRCDRGSGERGVIALNYTPTFEHFAATFDLCRILNDYRIVFEPSSYRNIEPSLFLFAGIDQTHVMECAHLDDVQILAGLPSSIVTIDLGSGDWTDPDLFSPDQSNQPVFDIVMVASWSHLKRHDVVFRSLKKLALNGFRPSIALIGTCGGLTIDDVKKLAHRCGVLEQCHFFDTIPQQQVSQIVSKSSVAIHFSKAEGTNRASYEAWFCNTPLIVFRHNMGFRMNYINDKTGMLADDDELSNAIKYVIEHRDQFSPREWILQHSGYQRATNRLNDLLRDIARDRKEPWTRDIVAKKNAPNFWYVNESDRLEMEDEYHDLAQYLR